jgi:hypothetical protein
MESVGFVLVICPSNFRLTLYWRQTVGAAHALRANSITSANLAAHELVMGDIFCGNRVYQPLCDVSL